MRNLKLLYALLLVGAAPNFAQTYGEISGTVNDPSGAAVVGAEVTITNLATNQIRRMDHRAAMPFPSLFRAATNWK